MSKGELPVGYIIAIVIGVAALAILGYWFFISGGQLGGTVSETTCRGKLLQYCAAWSACNYEGSCQPGGEDFYDAKNSQECVPHKQKLNNNNDDVKEACKILLGQSTGETEVKKVPTLIGGLNV